MVFLMKIPIVPCNSVDIDKFSTDIDVPVIANGLIQGDKPTVICRIFNNNKYSNIKYSVVSWNNKLGEWGSE
jgi:hypothetical protein